MAGRGLSAPAFAGGRAGSSSDRSEEEKGKLLELGGGKGCVTGRKALETVESGRSRPASTPGAAPAGRERGARPLPAPLHGPGVFPRCRSLERAPRPGAVPPGGGRRAGRGGAPSARLREAVRAGAGRVRPPGAAGRAAFLMCHQHVELARAARASGTPPTFEGSRRRAPLPAAPGSRSLGRGRWRPPGPGRLSEAPGPRPGARRAPGTSGRRARLAATCPTSGGGDAGSAVREGAACGGRRPARGSARAEPRPCAPRI